VPAKQQPGWAGPISFEAARHFREMLNAYMIGTGTHILNTPLWVPVPLLLEDVPLTFFKPDTGNQARPPNRHVSPIENGGLALSLDPSDAPPFSGR